MKHMQYDYLVVGAGLFGSVFAHKAKKAGKRVLIIDKRGHIGGNCYTESIEGVNVHKYGAHIFHTSDAKVWEFVNRFAQFNNFINSPLAVYNNEIYNLPFNMNTFSNMWGIETPAEANEIIQRQREESKITNPKNLEEQAIFLVGKDIYEKLIKGYTEKQWGRPCNELPADIIKRLPLRFTYDNNYFNDCFQGIPVGGYTRIFEKLLDGIEVKLNCDYLKNRTELDNFADKIIFTGTIDSYYGYAYGKLEYRSLRFDTEIFDTKNYQGNAVINYTSADIPFTRVIEHKHFEFGSQRKTVVTHEYPVTRQGEEEPYYPINNRANNTLYNKYLKKAETDSKVIFGGRLGEYKYLDMDKTVISALTLAEQIL